MASGVQFGAQEGHEPFQPVAQPDAGFGELIAENRATAEGVGAIFVRALDGPIPRKIDPPAGKSVGQGGKRLFRETHPIRVMIRGFPRASKAAASRSC